MLNRSVFLLIAALVALSSLSQAQTSQGASGADAQQGIDCTDPINAGAPSCQLGYGQNGQQPGYSGQQNPNGATQTGRTGANGLVTNTGTIAMLVREIALGGDFAETD